MIDDLYWKLHLNVYETHCGNDVDVFCIEEESLLLTNLSGGEAVSE